MLYRNRESKNIYTACRVIRPAPHAACKEDIIVLALQGKADGRVLDPDEMGTFQVFRSELNEEYTRIV
ncbi:MAG: hypothetical protein KAJ73_01105 [Zetaproteobacteria bacterium]|nr:hypothetical protein [Zetaproteobacteria bacterium]